MPVTEKLDTTPIRVISHGLAAEEIINKRIIDSSNVEWVAWPAPPANVALMMVKYKGNEKIYGYLGVSRQRAVATANAPSTGKYINQFIKPNYECVQIV